MRQGKARKYIWLLLIAWCGLLTFFLYGRSLVLPFFFDDFVHYPYVEANNLREIRLTTDQLAYYRPVNFSIWRITYQLMLGHNPVLDHGINLFFHALNGFLVGWLAARLWGIGGNQFPVVTREADEADWLRGVLSATLFLLYPFSYQAVPWVGSLSHITVTSLILLALASYVQMRRTRQRLWGVLSLFFTLLAPFAHENGMLIMPFIVAIELTTPQASKRLRHAFQSALIWSLPLMVYLSVWFTLPRLDNGRLFPNNLEGLLQNSAYFLQGAMYPFTAFGGRLYLQFGFNDMLTVTLLSGLGIFIALFIQVTHKASLRSLLPWVWLILASLPSIIFLVFEYVINGPRLLMVASVGAAWLWADVLLLFGRGVTTDSRPPLWRTVISSALLFLLLIQNGRFIQDRMDIHQALGDGFNQILASVDQAAESGQELVVINFPSWFAPRQAAYALGHEGVLFWPDYVPPGIFTAVHTGEFGDLSFVRVDGLRPDLEAFYYGLTGPNPDWPLLAAVPAEILLTVYDEEIVTLLPSGKLGLRENGTNELQAIFRAENGSNLVDLLDAKATAMEDGVRVDLTWQIRQPLENVTIFVHIVDEQGNLVGQADGEALGGSYPFELWEPGDQVLDTRMIETDAKGPFGVRVGLYDRQTGQRLPAFSGDEQQWPENSVPIEVEGEQP